MSFITKLLRKTEPLKSPVPATAPLDENTIPAHVGLNLLRAVSAARPLLYYRLQ